MQDRMAPHGVIPWTKHDVTNILFCFETVEKGTRWSRISSLIGSGGNKLLVNLLKGSVNSNIHGTSTSLQIKRMDSSLFPLCVYTNRSNRLDELCLSYTSDKPSLPSRKWILVSMLEPKVARGLDSGNGVCFDPSRKTLPQLLCWANSHG
jgi:hypothetical protein